MLLSRKSIYRGRVVDLGIERVTLPDGRQLDLEIVRHPGGAAVVAVDGVERLCLLRQYRHAAGGWLWEVPAGKLDGGEPPLEAARRELAEEAGMKASTWVALGDTVTNPGICDEIVHLFLARNLSPVAPRREPHELIEVHWLPLPEAVGLARTGEIRDAKTLVALFRTASRVSGHATP